MEEPAASAELSDWPALRSRMVVFENADVLAVNKPPELTVTGERDGPDIVALAEATAERLYPVHRIDKVASGLVLFAKALAAHGPLTRQFARRTVVKGYLVVVRAGGLPASWTVNLPLSVGRKNRVRIAGPRAAIEFDAARALWTLGDRVHHDKRVYPSVTVFHRLHERDGLTALFAQPVTGRRHQIRVHLAWTGCPILGDPLFRSTSMHPDSPRTYLHSWRLSMEATWTAAPTGRVDLVAHPDPSFWAPMGGESPLDAAEELWTAVAGP